MPVIQTGGGAPWPHWMDGLMNSAPGSINRRFPKYWSDGEGGIDFSVPAGTPVTALADGVVVGAGYFCNATKQFFLQSDSGACDHGVITTRVTNSDGSQTDLYYQHVLIDSSIKLSDSGGVGQVVKKGQVIATISGFGMIEMGINVGNSPNAQPYPNGWGGIWGSKPSPGPHVDPEPYLRALATGQNVTKSLIGGGIIGTILGGAIATATHLAPDASVAEFLTNIDVALELRNPFQVNITGGAQDFTVLGIDTGIPNPGADAAAVFSGFEQVLGNIVNDASALIVRGAFLLIGVIILWAVIQNIMMQAANQILEPVGGVQGAVKIAGAFA